MGLDGTLMPNELPCSIFSVFFFFFLFLFFFSPALGKGDKEMSDPRAKLYQFIMSLLLVS